MECQNSAGSKIYSGQKILSSLNQSVILPASDYSSKVINMDNITIVPQDDPLDIALSTDIISDDLDSNQKTYKLSESDFFQEFSLIQDNGLKNKGSENNVFSSNLDKKLIDILPSSIHQKPSNVALTKFCNDITAQKLSVMQGLIKKEANDRGIGTESVSNYVTAVEQPNIGICSCFVCGIILPDPNERFMYLDHQRLLGVKLTVLQFLSDILSQRVLTNSPEINLCQKCSDLINEADNISKQLNKIKSEIEKYFNENERPKLTYQIIPHFSNVISEAKKEMNANAEKAELSLRELAFTRPRHRNKIKSCDKTLKIGNCIKKKTLGRPRKPFQCSVCKLKFISEGLLDRHYSKEHITQKEVNFSKQNMNTVNVSNVSCRNVITQSNTNEIEVDENIDKNKVLPQNKITSPMPEIRLLQRLPEQRSTSLPPMPVRPIQPKPQTLYQLNNDGSVVFIMGPVANETTAALVTVTPSYINLSKHFYSCDLCRKQFVDEKSFNMHKIAAHGMRKNKADEEKIFTNKELKDGLNYMFECPLCESVFGSKILLFQHINIVHFTEHREKQGKLYKCEHCNKIFSFKYEMENHRETHLPYNKLGPHEFVCCVCGLRLASKAALKMHLHRYHKEEDYHEDYLCAKCGYMAHTKRAFTDHTRIHNNVSTIKMQCQLCKKEMRSSSFKIHMTRIHGEAKFTCKVCAKKFTVRSDLMRHNNAIHSNLRPYHCTECDRKFVTAEALRYHKKKLHTNISHYCEVCGNNYRLKDELLDHMDNCHNEFIPSYECTICSKSNLDHRKLKLHMAIKHKIYKDVCYEKDETISSKYESGTKKIIPPGENELTLENYESQDLLLPGTLVNDPDMSSTQSHIEHCIEEVHSASLRNIKIYHEPQEESIVLTAIHTSDSFQNDNHLHSTFTSADTLTQMENIFTEAKHLESNFADHIHNVDPIYAVRQYEES